MPTNKVGALRRNLCHHPTQANSQNGDRRRANKIAGWQHAGLFGYTQTDRKTII
jgi:hypothetical protein